jgi:hypothetical protein
MFLIVPREMDRVGGAWGDPDDFERDPADELYRIRIPRKKPASGPVRVRILGDIPGCTWREAV